MRSEIELDMRWERNCAVPEISRTFKVLPDSDPVACEVTTQTASEKFQLNNVKLYVLVVTLSIIDKIKFLKNVKQGFK